MQTCEEGCFNLDWDLNNTDNWERLLPRESGFAPGVNDELDVDEDDRRQQDKHLEMPFSYVENIELQSLGKQLLNLCKVFYSFVNFLLPHDKFYSVSFV